MRTTILVSTLLCGAAASPLSWLFPREQKCNGYAALCDRKYSDVSFIATHDSPFWGDENDPRLTQTRSVPDQLKAGIRYMESQTHKDPLDPSSLNMCHSSCFLENRGPVTTYLQDVKTFLDANPNEVLTLLMVNGDHVDPSLFDKAFRAAGLVDYVFVPKTSDTSRSAWPTLGEMIASKKRLVVLLDSGADTSKVNYLLDEYTYLFETKYQNYSPADFAQCEDDRGKSNADSKMYIMNHFRYQKLFDLDIPDPKHAAETNAASGNEASIGSQVDVCRKRWARTPNVVFVDFFEKGDVFKAERAMNGF